MSANHLRIDEPFYGRELILRLSWNHERREVFSFDSSLFENEQFWAEITETYRLSFEKSQNDEQQPSIK